MSSPKSINPRPAYISAAEELRHNPEQWAAYESVGNCVMLAGPGSGKTKTLTIKLARLLNEEVKFPQGIACITYSTECARELKQRLTILGVEENPRVFIGTIHGFCLKNIILPFAHLSDVKIAKPILVPTRQKWQEIFEQVILDLKIMENPRYVVGPMQKYRRTILERNSPEWQKDKEIALLIETFEDKLRSYGYIDFDDMVLLGLRLIKENSWVRNALKAKFPILVVDEYQDLGAPLHQIVLNLCLEAGVRIIAVGDPDQSIYGFSGANSELLVDLASRVNVEPIILKTNYRSGKKIIASSMVALEAQRDYVAAGDYEGVIIPHDCPGGITEQAELICSKIIPDALASKEGRSLGDIGILYIDKNDATVITSAVKAHGYKYIGGGKEIRYTTTPITRWLEDCAAWCAIGWQTGEPRLKTIIAFWESFNEARYNSLFQRELRRSIVAFLIQYRNPDMLLADWLKAFAEIGLEDALARNHINPEEKESYEILVNAANDPEKLADMTVGGFGKLRGASDHLNLVTLHSSKGLEFDVVIMMGLEQGRLPSYAVKAAEPKREARRIFYVGLTRARHEVHLVYSGFYITKSGIIHRQGPSEFVVQVLNSLDQ